ncbi:MAG: helix-turn-helix domain-containing protein [Euryhalocaulis sp.]|uniref:helix-turn-helix domain-containing protein n=1 Tax=Euryhalocaulis sp. TaxID=2744307 RepID=UPI0018298C25|nr:helix-turn-helix domain-containing protein [Euryhalocaulis sp.]MBA4801736.1 helix-turn-helix domain-containing protein [Euryhalocaulis sp.]
MTAIGFSDEWFGDEVSGFEDEHVGAQLRQARLERGLELADAATALRIKEEYLTALEEADPLALPPRAYAVSFARNYATFLGLDPCHIAEGVKNDCRFRDGYKPELIQPEAPPEQRLPRGLAGAIGVFALAAVAMTWYGYNAPANSASEDTPPVPAALAEWSFDEAPQEADASIWNGLAGESAEQQDTATEAATEGAPSEVAAAE